MSRYFRKTKDSSKDFVSDSPDATFVITRESKTKLGMAFAIGIALLVAIVMGGVLTDTLMRKCSRVYSCTRDHVYNLGPIRESAIWCNRYDPLWVTVPDNIPEPVQKRIDQMKKARPPNRAGQV